MSDIVYIIGVGMIKFGKFLTGEALERQISKHRIAMTENGGGTIGVGEAAMAIHILEKVYLKVQAEVLLWEDLKEEWLLLPEDRVELERPRYGCLPRRAPR